MTKDKTLADFIDVISVKLPTPTKAQIESVIKKIEKRLLGNRINRDCNAPVKDGYTMALQILKNRQNIYFKGIDKLHSTQARAIAMLAIDYLNGECHPDILCNIPIKRSK